jgi:hypothetical protein
MRVPKGKRVLNMKHDLPPVGSTFEHLVPPDMNSTSSDGWRFVYRVKRHNLSYAYWPGLNEGLTRPSKKDLEGVPLRWTAELDVVVSEPRRVAAIAFRAAEPGQLPTIYYHYADESQPKPTKE